MLAKYHFQKKQLLWLVFFGCCFSSRLAFALEFQPGVGLGAQYTDNAELASDNKASDIITIGSVAASIAEAEGHLVYGADASFRRESYTNDTFEDKRYFNLGLNANWEILEERLSLNMTDEFTQTPIRSLAADTPTNRQDSNAFIFGAEVDFLISGRQKISILPVFSQYYYKDSPTDNKQYTLSANWSYQMFRTTNVGLIISGREITYVDKSIADITFINAGLIVSGQRVHSKYSVNLGATNVNRDEAVGVGGKQDASKNTGFSGSVKWQTELSSRSAIDAVVLSELTDTSSVSRVSSPGNSNAVQLAADVIRNSIVGLTYTREDASLHTSIFGEYRKVRYSDNTILNSLVQTFGAKLDFPVTQLVSSGVFLNFDNTKREETFRVDKRFNVGANINVTFTSKLSGTFDIQYRTKESTDSLQNYDEFSAFARLNYGFGQISQRTIAR